MKVFAMLAFFVLIAMLISVSILMVLDQKEQEAKFIEIHGVEDNNCWCPDDCDISGGRK